MQKLSNFLKPLFLVLAVALLAVVPVREHEAAGGMALQAVVDSLTKLLPPCEPEEPLPELRPAITISAYDHLLKKYSDEIGWDWQLLASVMYQESRFNPEARSPQGAFGLMQLMPDTGARFGIDTTSSAEEQIAAGVRYLAYLDRLMTRVTPDEKERIKFILASYNVGPGHVFDAVRLAESAGKETTVWDNNVDSCLLSKSLPEVYTRPEVRNGYCRGSEAFSYVRSVMARYEMYMTGQTSIR
ncbi:MAG: transglycosylase SLT domain-containing protein [Bacteroidales bacterium]|nr:transglycosylase SLT domain-containing protein [Bacteroidales bacterium]